MRNGRVAQLSHRGGIYKVRPILATLFIILLTPPFLAYRRKRTIMAPLPATAVSAGLYLLKRDLTVDHTQAVTLGVMAAYVVVIALLWNLPYVRWSLWPFKVRLKP